MDQKYRLKEISHYVVYCTFIRNKQNRKVFGEKTLVTSLHSSNVKDLYFIFTKKRESPTMILTIYSVVISLQ